MTLPTKALSIRQPWVWAICYGGKRLENRAWGGWNNHQKKFRGEFCIHAASGMTREDYRLAREFMMDRCGVEPPPAKDLVRGAIVATAKVVGWATKSINPWFMGPGALIIDEVKILDAPIPCSGALGWFDWKPNGEEICAPAKWMLPKAEKPTPPTVPDTQETLL